MKWGTTIHGITVQGAPETLPDYLHRHKLDEVIIAMPSAAGRRMRVIVGLLNQNRPTLLCFSSNIAIGQAGSRLRSWAFTKDPAFCGS